jgi:hypothetical protein
VNKIGNASFIVELFIFTFVALVAVPDKDPTTLA